MAYYHLSLLQISSGEYINAREYAQKARAVLERGKFRVQMLDCYKTLSDIYAKLGDYERSLEYYKLYDALGDSLASVESSLQIAEIQGKYETATKDREIATLRAEESLQTYWRNVAILGALFAILLALLVWNRYRIKKESEASLQEKNVALRRANSAIQEQQELLAEHNAELERKNLRLEELNDEKNEFLGIAAHDLKSPLASIRMNTELMLLEKISEQDLKHSIHSIQNLSSKMSELIQNLLDINAIENGGVQFYEQKLNMNVLVRQSIENYRLAAEQKNLQLTLNEQPTPPVIADETALTQVLDNLLSNAVKFSHAGKGISIHVGVRADTVRVEVQDEGPGLSPDDMKKLFGKFARLSARPTGGEHSTGLGLSIVKKMVEAMQGRVWCESELGKGATFIVEFPVIS
ncbi:MAG: ATP-binding protein [Candidatus Kapaibacteriota bacterium]